MNIVRGTTPRIRICMSDVNGRNIDFSGFDVVILTLTDGTHRVDIEKSDMTFNTDRTIDVNLTQAETLSLSGFEVDIQLRAKDDDNAIASDICTVDLSNILKEGAI